MSQSGATITAPRPRRSPAEELDLGSTQGALGTQATGNTDGSGAVALSFAAAQLSPGTTYYYRLLATNLNGASGIERRIHNRGRACRRESHRTAAVACVSRAAGDRLPLDSRRQRETDKSAAAGESAQGCKREAKGKRKACERKARKRYA